MMFGLVLALLGLQPFAQAYGCKVVVCLLAHSNDRGADTNNVIGFLLGKKLSLDQQLEIYCMALTKSQSETYLRSNYGHCA